MKAIKLTPKERELFEHLKATPGGILRQHIKATNTMCFRLLDSKRNPLMNYRYGLVMQLIDKNVIERTVDFEYVLRADSDEQKNKYKNIGLVSA